MRIWAPTNRDWPRRTSPGPALHDAVAARGPLAVEAVPALTAQVAEALQSIHAAGVIHRDLKPSNILLSADGPKVIDFGIARAADVTSVTSTGMLAGTPGYMAPEYIRGESLTEAVGIFALGAIAAYAATARPAFGGTGHKCCTAYSNRRRISTAAPSPFGPWPPAALAKDPAERPGLAVGGRRGHARTRAEARRSRLEDTGQLVFEL